MSAAGKRGVHEEGVHSSSSSMRPGFGVEEEEKPGYPRVNYGAVQDTRPGYLPRPESRDGERRSPLHSVYKMPLSVTDTPHGSHPVAGLEIRAESRDAKDVRENKGVESNRDAKVEAREMHHLVVKPEKECRVDENKVEKDVYGAAGSHTNWKEQHRVKKHPDVPGGGGRMAGFWMGPPQVRKYDAVKHVTPTFLCKETNESMGEDRVDLKGDKERKRKEGKHHDWPESDKDRSDYKSNVQVGSGSNIDSKEVTKEDKESEHWGMERKDVLKEKERLEEREKDYVDRESRSGGEKEGYQNEKEMADKPPVRENFGLEQKKPESWRNMEREAKERRRERDIALQGERPEKRSRGHDKESDEVSVDVDVGHVALDRDRDVSGGAVQQRKRMLCHRGSPQVANRDGRLMSRGQDGEG